MMTSLEARLSGADPVFTRELHDQLVQAQGIPLFTVCDFAGH